MSSLVSEAVVRPTRGTAAAWTSNNPTLAAGQVGYETDTGKTKIGDGSTAWTSLTYSTNGDISLKPTGTTDQLCKAWVNFDGTGTPSINESYNVTSITDNDTGDYTINFTSALNNANYAVAATVGSYTTSNSNRSVAVFSQTTAGVRISVQTTAGAGEDATIVNVIIFGT